MYVYKDKNNLCIIVDFRNDFDVAKNSGNKCEQFSVIKIFAVYALR